jgi:hypothetical protein
MSAPLAGDSAESTQCWAEEEGRPKAALLKSALDLLNPPGSLTEAFCGAGETTIPACCPNSTHSVVRTARAWLSPDPRAFSA